MDIKIKDFEGPLDLLLHLVSKYQMDIYEVPFDWGDRNSIQLLSCDSPGYEIRGSREYMLMASQLTPSRVVDFFPWGRREMDEAEDLEQDLLSIPWKSTVLTSN